MNFITKECAKCGQIFIPGAEHLYVLNKTTTDDTGRKVKNKRYYCSYSCWRKDGGDNRG